MQGLEVGWASTMMYQPNPLSVSSGMLYGHQFKS